MKLYNNLADVLVVVGVDRSTGLVPCSEEECEAKTQDAIPSLGLYGTPFESFVLAAISSEVAYFPNSNPQQDPNYPPSTKKSATLKSGSGKKLSKHEKGDEGSTKHISSASDFFKRLSLKHGQSKGDASAEAEANSEWKPSPSVRRKVSNLSRKGSVRIRTVDLVKKNINAGDTKMESAKLPLNSERLETITSLCFPDGLHVFKQRPADKLHSLVLTDVEGNRDYATCLTHYSPNLVTKVEDGTWNCTPERPLGRGSCSTCCYLPICYVLLSSQPYFTVLKDCLSRLLQKIEQGQDEDDTKQTIKEFALQMTLTAVPPSGQLTLQFNLYDVFISISPPDVPGEPAVDIATNLVLQHLDIDHILTVMTCLLAQQKLVFLSSSYALLTNVTESFLHFIHPFKWYFTYVPVLPAELLELAEAPTSFILGCHVRYKKQLQQISDLILVDLDSGHLVLGDAVTIPSMPSEVSELFKLSARRLCANYQLVTLESPTTFSYEESKAAETKYRTEFNTEMRVICLQLLVNLFRDTLAFIRGERFFKWDQFLCSRKLEEKKFYEQVVGTEMFSEFIKERMSQKEDAWSLLEEQTRPSSRNSLALTLDVDGRPLSGQVLCALPKLPRGPPKSMSSPSLKTMGMSPEKTVTNNVLILPNFLYSLSSRYIESCLQEVGKNLKECRSSTLRATYLYLRGMFNAALDKKLDALEDFHSLGAHDNRVFPADFVNQLLHSLTPDEKDSLKRKSFYIKRSGVWRVPSGEINEETDQHPVVMRWDKIPQNDIDVDSFTNLVQMLEIAEEFDTIGRLFRALTLEKTTVIDPATFEEFYKCWKEVEMLRRKVSQLDPVLEPIESLLKLSDVVKTTLGTGRIALTQKRLFFLPDGSKKCKEITSLRNIKSLEKIQQKSFFTHAAALKIITRDEKSKPFIATLKSFRNLWYMLVNEMWSGKLISEEVREPSILHRAAKNVLLVDALMKSSEAEFSFHFMQGEEVGALLCNFSRRREEGLDSLPPETKELLQHRVDPNAREAERMTVEALLYTPGNRSSDAGEDSGPKLWCGLGNGKIIIFDASTWTLLKQFIEAKDRIVCLLSVGDRHVWAGSFDTLVYVIDSQTKTCNQILDEHTDLVSDMTKSKDGKTIYTASLNGQILAWDLSTMQTSNQLQLEDVRDLRAVVYHRDHLWCLTKDQVLQVDLSGYIQRKLQHIDSGPETFNQSPIQLDCLLVADNELWLGCGKQGNIAVYDLDSFKLQKLLYIRCRGVSKIVAVKGKVWVGSKDGRIYIFDMKTRNIDKELVAHEAPIRSVCSAEDRYVMTGASSKDGRIAIWRTSLDKAIHDLVL